jgi:hypothetical protein
MESMEALNGYNDYDDGEAEEFDGPQVEGQFA